MSDKPVKNLPTIYTEPDAVIPSGMYNRARREASGKQAGKAVSPAVTIGALVAVALLLMALSVPGLGVDKAMLDITLFIILICIVGWLYAAWDRGLIFRGLGKPRNANHNEDTAINFSCPLCKHRWNINLKWVCGNCGGEGHGKRLYQTPFNGCAAPYCNERHQSAVQCPSCKRHLIFDLQRYRDLKTYQGPHLGAARMESDRESPKVYSEKGSVQGLQKLFSDF